MIEFLNNLDTSAFLAINGAHSPFFDSFMTIFSGRFVWIPMYLAVLWILYRSCRWQTATAYLLALGLAILLTDQTCATIIRPMVERLRPANLENPLSDYAYIVDGYRGGSYGFPSCHAANSFALAVFMLMFVKRRGFTIFIIGWALLNSYSRLYLGVHYPGDLLVGAIIGSIFGALCCLAISNLTRIFPDRLPPDRYDTPEAPVTLRQLTTGAPLMSLTPIDATLLQPTAAGRLSAYNLVVSDLMIATFAITLTIIIISSALG